MRTWSSDDVTVGGGNRASGGMALPGCGGVDEPSGIYESAETKRLVGACTRHAGMASMARDNLVVEAHVHC